MYTVINLLSPMVKGIHYSYAFLTTNYLKRFTEFGLWTSIILLLFGGYDDCYNLSQYL